MNLPKIVADLINAQNHFDSQAYTNCFSETAVVFDEGQIYTGKVAIKNWIENANQKYKTHIKPLEYSAAKQLLKAEISGTFSGSPIVLTYEFEWKDGWICSLRIG